jgi:NitT/TauT family transport system substrate-binding protein
MRADHERRWSMPLAAVLLTAALMVLVGACGGDDDDDGGGGGGGDASSGQSQEVAQVDFLLSFPESIAWGPLLVARELGYFEDERVEVTTEETEGSSFVTQQLIAGNAEWGWPAGDSIILAAAKEPDLRVVACTHAQNVFRIVSLESSDVDSVADLEGKTLGITEKGGGEEPMINAALRREDILDDVQVLPVGSGPQSRRALETGQIAAFSAGYPDMATFRSQGLEIRDITPEIFSRTPGDCLLVNKSTLEDQEKRDVTVRATRAWTKGAVYMAENPDAALDLVCPQVPEECKDRAFAEEFMKQTVELLKPAVPDVPIMGLDVEGWQQAANVLRDAGTLEEDVDIELLVNSPEVQEMTKEIHDFDAEEIRQQAAQAGG